MVGSTPDTSRSTHTADLEQNLRSLQRGDARFRNTAGSASREKGFNKGSRRIPFVYRDAILNILLAPLLHDSTAFFP